VWQSVGSLDLKPEPQVLLSLLTSGIENIVFLGVQMIAFSNSLRHPSSSITSTLFGLSSNPPEASERGSRKDLENLS
jgi:hypothetical protein